MTLQGIVPFVQVTNWLLFCLDRHATMASRKAHIVLLELLLEFPLASL